ncbi:hypothetical protein MHYP_G00119150 [Metynnis hypsauchen]
MPDGVALLQYVNDLAVCAPSRSLCEQASLALLKHLAKEGHKASKNKLQLCKEEVVFLGHILKGDTHTLAVDRTSAIAKLPKPNTKKQLLSFLGTCSYRSFVPSYAELEAPLRDIILTKHLVWTAEAEKAFCELKLALQQVPALGIPSPDRPFTQTVDEKNGCMTSVLSQKHGDRLRPVAYFSSKLDPVVRGLPLCLRAVAAAEKAVVASRNLVGYAPLTLLVPHAVHNILQDQKVSHLSAQGWLRYHTTLLKMPNITVKAVLPSPADCPLHPFQPGDQVLVKDLRRNKWNQPRWRGPFQVLLVTHTAVKIEGRATWVHHTHCKKAPTETTPPQVTPE